MHYEDNNRGTFQHRELARRLIDFDGLRYGNITPTDIDGIIEYKNIAYIIYEFKYCNSMVPYGQELCLKRMCDDLSKEGKIAVFLICEHYRNDGSDINASLAKVRELYYNGKIYSIYAGKTVKEVTDKIIKRAEQEIISYRKKLNSR